jgi:hypothetical protein
LIIAADYYATPLSLLTDCFRFIFIAPPIICRLPRSPDAAARVSYAASIADISRSMPPRFLFSFAAIFISLHAFSPFATCRHFFLS